MTTLTPDVQAETERCYGLAAQAGHAAREFRGMADHLHATYEPGSIPGEEVKRTAVELLHATARKYEAEKATLVKRAEHLEKYVS